MCGGRAVTECPDRYMYKETTYGRISSRLCLTVFHAIRPSDSVFTIDQTTTRVHLPILQELCCMLSLELKNELTATLTFPFLFLSSTAPFIRT